MTAGILGNNYKETLRISFAFDMVAMVKQLAIPTFL